MKFATLNKTIIKAIEEEYGAKVCGVYRCDTKEVRYKVTVGFYSLIVNEKGEVLHSLRWL